MGHDPHPDRPAALQDWSEAFGTPPPPFLSVGFMQKATAHEAQCRRHGGLPATTRRILTKIATGEKAEFTIAPKLSPGAHLVREWNGRTYQVHVTENGFEMDGKTWRSLSAIAKHITGATWSGPRFFGLNTQSKSRR